MSTRDADDGDRTQFEKLRHALFEIGAKGGTGKILILTHSSPDPDALGALVGVRFLFKHGLARESQVATVGRVQRAENLAMIRELSLNFENYDEIDRSEYDAIVLVDSQPGFGHTVVPDDLPFLAVIDHHEPCEGDSQAMHSDVRPDVGATSSLVYEYVRDAGLELDTHAATSLFCGIRFDTGDLSHNSTPLDEEAYYACLKRADKRQLARIQTPPLPALYYRELASSLRLARKHGPLILGLLGEVSNPEWIAEMADFFLRMDDCQWSFVGGAYEGRYHLSVRTKRDFRPAYPILEKVLDGAGSYGGHGRVAGGQLVLKDASEEVLLRTERELRARALRLLGEGPQAEAAEFRVGSPLTE